MTYALHAVIVKKPVTKKKLEEIREHFINSREKSFMRETGKSFRVRNHSKQKFISKTFRTKKINPSVSLVFGKLKPEWVQLEEHANKVRHLKGAGVLDYFKNKFNQVGSTISSGVRSVKEYFSPRLDDYNNKSKANINKYGNMMISKMHIYRTPLSSKVNSFLNLLSFGKLAGIKKKYGFDDFFHLALVCTIGNKHVMCQKNSVVDITESYKTTELTEIFNIKMKGKQFTLNDMLDKTRARMGDQAYFEYDMLSHNCQNYVANLLISEDLYTPDVEAFVYQNIAEIIKEIPEYSKRLIRGTTDLDATINKLTGGTLERSRACGGGAEEDFNDFIKKQRRILGLGNPVNDVVLDETHLRAVPYGRPQDSMKQPNFSDNEGVVPNKNDLLNRTALPINYPRNPAPDIKPYNRIVGSGFHLYTLAQLKQIVKAFELHTKIKMTGLKREQLLTEIEKHLVIKGDKIYIKSDNFDMPKFKLNSKMKKHTESKSESKPESKPKPKPEPKTKNINDEIKALIKEIKESGDKYKINVNNNEEEINKLNEMIKNYDLRKSKASSVVESSKQFSKYDLKKYVDRLNYLLHDILNYVEKFDKTKDIFKYDYYKNPIIREYAHNMSIAEEGNTAGKSHYNKVLKKWEDRILIDVYKNEGFINQYRIIMYIFNELKKYYPSIFKNYPDNGKDAFYNIFKTQSDIDRIDKFYEMYNSCRYATDYTSRSHQSDYEDFNKKVDISRKIINLYDKEKMQPYMKFYALILFLSQYKTLDEVEMIYNDIEHYKNKYITKKDIKLSIDKIEKSRSDNVDVEMKKQFKDEIDKKIKVDKPKIEEKHNEDDIKLPKLSDAMIEKIKSKIHPKHEMKKEVYAVLQQIKDGKQYIPLTGHNHMIMNIILRIKDYEI